MIIVAGHIRTKPELVEELAGILRAGIAETKLEDGCLDYNFALDDKAEGTILVYERWRDEAALTTHLGLPSIAELLSAWGDKIEAQVRIFDASNERGMGE